MRVAKVQSLNNINVRPLRIAFDDYSHNRDFIGEYWNRKHIRAIQAILNSTKGKIGRGESFFNEAFGHNKEEFYELLEMPETFILYRYFFKWLKDKHPHSTDNWRKCYNDCMQTLGENEKIKVIKAIHDNEFSEVIQCQFTNPKSRQLIEFYTNYRNAIVKEGTELYKLKKEYDKNPTIALKRKRG
jgi:hypothetical protein